VVPRATPDVDGIALQRVATVAEALAATGVATGRRDATR